MDVLRIEVAEEHVPIQAVRRCLRAGKYIHLERPRVDLLSAFKMVTAVNLAIGHLANERFDAVPVYFCYIKL